jgi:predicted nucleic acid-binding Zn ribbon protein
MHDRRTTMHRQVRSVVRGPHGGEPLHGILTRALHANGISRRMPRRIPAAVWERAVGVELAARAQPTSLTAGTLHVLVQDHRWRDQLDAARNFLVESINKRLGAGAVRELQFGLAHEGALAEGRRRAGLGALPAPEEIAVEPGRFLGEARLEPALREAVLRAAEAAHRRRV